MKRSRTSKLSDARLKVLLKGLRQDVAAPPDFSARVLKSLRAKGLVPGLPEVRPGGGWWVRLGARFWARPSWGLSLAAGLVVVLSLGWVLHPFWRACDRDAVPASVIGVPKTASVAPHAASTLALVAPRRTRSRPARFLAARSASRSGSTVLAYNPVSRAVRGLPATGHVESASLVASAPLVGLGSTASGTGLSATVSGLVATDSRLPAGASVGASIGSPAKTTGFSSYRSSAGSLGPTPTPVPTATPQKAPTPSPALGSNSQVRNNVILASRGQSARILFKVAQAGP
ncbi:MAG: hypothetical protein ACREKE_02705, partial [bacterium]